MKSLLGVPMGHIETEGMYEDESSEEVVNS
jgi:hypothetical protein